MLARSDIHRSITRMSLDMTRAIGQRTAQTAPYKAGEYEVQFQFNVWGKAGTLPVETEVEMPFGVLFYADPGTARSSALDRPLARLAMELSQGPAGLVPYAFVSSWERDADFNFVGARVKFGVHLPAMSILGASPPSVDFRGLLHAAFQSYGAPADSENLVGDGIGASFRFDDYDEGVG